MKWNHLSCCGYSMTQDIYWMLTIREWEKRSVWINSTTQHLLKHIVIFNLQIFMLIIVFRRGILLLTNYNAYLDWGWLAFFVLQSGHVYDFGSIVYRHLSPNALPNTDSTELRFPMYYFTYTIPPSFWPQLIDTMRRQRKRIVGR